MRSVRRENGERAPGRPMGPPRTYEDLGGLAGEEVVQDEVAPRGQGIYGGAAPSKLAIQTPAKVVHLNLE